MLITMLKLVTQCHINYVYLFSARVINPPILHCRYWKLSLLVHPDKCPHPSAQEAFVKLNNAFKDLQDPDKVYELKKSSLFS